jgi:hypothetical protein
MPTDAERWRFLADNSLVLNRDARQGVSIMHYQSPDGSAFAAKYRSVATGNTADEAIDNAIARWAKQARKKPK